MLFSIPFRSNKRKKKETECTAPIQGPWIIDSGPDPVGSNSSQESIYSSNSSSLLSLSTSGSGTGSESDSDGTHRNGKHIHLINHCADKGFIDNV